jgi:putative ATPase
MTENHRPLAEIARPTDAASFVGQSALWAPDAPLRRMVESGRLRAAIFWGPPGCGKTSLARIICQSIRATQFHEVSAVSASVKDLRSVFELSRHSIQSGLGPHLLFLDEVHRLSKSQQDVLLPVLESGEILFIGATTENPSFEVNKAILSRSMVFSFKRHSPIDLEAILRQAILKSNDRLLQRRFSDDMIRAIAASSDGDARQALKLLEAVAASVPDETETIDVASLKPFIPHLMRQFDQSGDAHYDLASALIKSIRASQPDAAVYYLARMIDGGEDAMFIARRLVIAASEDIGNANPTALLVATSAMQASQMVGYPEARIILAQATTYLACSPKSNRSYAAINEALSDVQSSGSLPVPLHLRNAPTQLMKQLGYGKEYIYAHDDQRRAAAMSNLPDELKDRRYYQPSDVGVEKQLKQNLASLLASLPGNTHPATDK